MLKYIIIFSILAIVGGAFYLLFRYPQGTIISLTKWQYRMLRKIKSEYLWGQKKAVPDSYDYFRRQAIALLDDELRSHQDILATGESRSQKASEIVEMLDYPHFIHHYFTDFSFFSGAIFHDMYQDYRTGVYNTKDYSAIEELRKKLPREISSSDKAFNHFMKFVDAGWFDIKTGHFKLDKKRNRHLYNIGVAVDMIGKWNGIKSPENVFAELWNVDPEKIKEWTRGSRTFGKDEAVKEVERIMMS